MLPVLGLVTGSLRRKGATQTGPFGLLVFVNRHISLKLITINAENSFLQIRLLIAYFMQILQWI
jgi:hypothetical protein